MTLRTHSLYSITCDHSGCTVRLPARAGEHSISAEGIQSKWIGNGGWANAALHYCFNHAPRCPHCDWVLPASDDTLDQHEQDCPYLGTPLNPRLAPRGRSEG